MNNTDNNMEGDNLKAIFISYNQAYHELILELLKKLSITGFTSWNEVSGRGSRGGDPHLGSHAWPTLNSAMLLIIPQDRGDLLLDELHKLDKRAEDQGLRAFVWSIDKTI